MKDRRFAIEGARRADCGPDELLTRILTPQTWPSWQSEILRVEGPARLAPGDVVTGDAKLLGFEVEGRSTALEVAADAFEEDVIVGVRMRVRYEVARNGRGAQVSHHLETKLPRGAAGRVLAFLLKWRLRRMQRRLLDDLVAGCERGRGSGDR